MSFNSNNISFEGSYATPLIQDSSQKEPKNVHRYKLARLRGNSVKQLCSKSLAAVGRHKEGIKRTLCITAIALCVLAAFITIGVFAPISFAVTVPVTLLLSGLLILGLKGKLD